MLDVKQLGNPARLGDRKPLALETEIHHAQKTDITESENVGNLLAIATSNELLHAVANVKDCSERHLWTAPALRSSSEAARESPSGCAPQQKKG